MAQFANKGTAIPSTPADGNTRTYWVPAIADIMHPRTSELEAGENISCYITLGGFAFSTEQAKISDPRECSAQDYEAAGRESVSDESAQVIDNTNSPYEKLGMNRAVELLTQGSDGYWVRRRGLPADTPWADGQKVTVIQAQIGRKQLVAGDENSVTRSTIPFFATGPWSIEQSVIVDDMPHTLPETVTLDQTSLSVEQGRTATLKATVLPADAEDTSVTWSSDHEDVATVSNGVVRAIKPGTATITAATVNGLTATCAITVTQPAGTLVPVTGITLTPATASVEEGKTVTLKPTIQPANATDTAIAWTSDNEQTATVRDGVVTGVKAGTATITATTHDGGKTATAKITVTAPAPTVTLKAYSGVSASNAPADLTEAFIKGLTAKTVTGSAAGDYQYTPDPTANNGDGTYDVFALPASLPAPSFATGGFHAPFTKTTTLTVDGVSVDVWVSDNPMTDAHTIKVS